MFEVDLYTEISEAFPFNTRFSNLSTAVFSPLFNAPIHSTRNRIFKSLPPLTTLLITSICSGLNGNGGVSQPPGLNKSKSISACLLFTPHLHLKMMKKYYAHRTRNITSSCDGLSLKKNRTRPTDQSWTAVWENHHVQ